jgi:hypothetical protein
VCPEDPWNENARRTVVIAQGGKGPPGEAPTSFRPWALLLANGQRCFRVGGATETTAGLRHNYQCFAPPFARNARQPVGKAGGVVVGEPDQRPAAWTAQFKKTSTNTALTRVEVRQAYE